VWLVTSQGGRCPHKCAQRLEITVNQTLSPSLDQQVSDGRSFYGSGDHRPARGVGRQLAEQLVAAPAADHVDDVKPLS
jgi:hypothetical protein